MTDRFIEPIEPRRLFAASTMRIPAALTEADAHLGLANRLAAPFARRLFLAYPIESRWSRRSEVVGRPIPARSRAIPQAEAREIFELPKEGRVLGVLGALAGARSLNEFVADTWGEAGPHVLVTVSDTGAGIKPEVRRRLFAEPFFTTKVRHRGLGLAVAFRILSAHRGGVQLDPAPPPGPGTVARVVLPLLFAGDWTYTDDGILDRTHLRFFTRKTALSLVQGAGFRVEAVRATGLDIGGKAFWVNLATLGLFRPLLEFQYLIKGRNGDPPAG